MGDLRVFVGTVWLVGILVLTAASTAYPYSQYSQNGDATNCAACHGDFRATGYISRVDGSPWGTSLMSGHNSMVSSDCSACHLSGHFPVFTNSSSGGSLGLSASGCVGCHGRAADAGHGSSDGRGAGLRQHHDRSGITVCRSCHSDANTINPTYTPVVESIEPYNYFTPDANHSSKPTDSCDANGTESVYGATGLDNDGNGLYDGADPACGLTTTTFGGSTTTSTTTTTFEGGTTSTTTTTTLEGGTTTSTTTTTTFTEETTTTLVAATTTSTTLPDIDADGDGIPDADDPCNNSGDHDITIKPKVILKRLGGEANDDRLLVKGEFIVTTPFTDLAAGGLRVIGYRNDGSLSFDIPIGQGASKDEKKILFRDDTGMHNGIVKFQVLNRSKKAPNQVKVIVKGKNGSYPFASGDEPIRVIVAIGDGSIGDCGETSFTPAQCGFNGAGNAMKCR